MARAVLRFVCCGRFASASDGRSTRRIKRPLDTKWLRRRAMAARSRPSMGDCRRARWQTGAPAQCNCMTRRPQISIMAKDHQKPLTTSRTRTAILAGATHRRSTTDRQWAAPRDRRNTSNRATNWIRMACKQTTICQSPHCCDQKKKRKGVRLCLLFLGSTISIETGEIT